MQFQKEVYLWDYTHAYAIAKVANASFNDVAYTSFEADSSGNWNINYSAIDTTMGLTGKRSYKLSNGAITKSNLTSANTYIVSYWTRNDSPLSISGTLTGYPIVGRKYNGWTYYEHQISGQSTITVSGVGNIDELRLYPYNAQMITYTYTPLVGISCITDAKNSISYYEYDMANRLQSIRDQDGNITKNIQYNLAAGSVNYGAHLVYFNDAQSKSFTKTDCTSGFGTSKTYTINAGLYKSIISSDDANNQAKTALDTYGTAQIATEGQCVICNNSNNKFINGTCETGNKVYTSSQPRAGAYLCTYHYEWSDGTKSIDYTENSSTDCMLL